MRIYMNDASIQGQFSGKEDEFLKVLKKLIAIKNRFAEFDRDFYIVSKIKDSIVYDKTSFINLLFGLNDRENQSLKINLLRWIEKARPENEHLIYQGQEAILEFCTFNVTDTAISLAVDDTKNKINCSLFSFQGGQISYEVSPLLINEVISGTPVGKHEIANIWEPDTLENILKSARPRCSWEYLQNLVKSDLPNLEFRSEIFLTLKNQPFDRVIFEEIFRRMSTLNQYVENRTSGIENKEATRIRNDDIQNSSYFSDDNATDKARFKNELNFDRMNERENQSTKWHGKIKKNQFRVYFEWPLEKNRNKLEIFYIGPKFTKH